MAADAALYSLLTNNATVAGLVSTRIYPVVAPQNIALPFVVYQRISTPRDYTQDGPSLLSWPRFQITSVATTYDGARALAEAIRKALNGYTGTAASTTVYEIRLDNEQDEYEPNLLPTDKGGYSVRQDYIVSHKETA